MPDRRRVHGDKVRAKSICHRKEDVEEQFVALLKNLTASPYLVAAYAARDSNGGENERALRKRLTSIRTEVGSFGLRRERLFNALESGALSNDEFAERFEALKGRERNAQDQMTEAQAALTAAKARIVSIADAARVVRATAATWLRVSAEDQQAMARVLADALGGLIVRVDGHLTLSPTERKSSRTAVAVNGLD